MNLVLKALSELECTRFWYNFVISHYSLYHSCLPDSGAIALARALQQNKSLEKLKYVSGKLIDAL